MHEEENPLQIHKERFRCSVEDTIFRILEILHRRLDVRRGFFTTIFTDTDQKEVHPSHSVVTGTGVS